MDLHGFFHGDGANVPEKRDRDLKRSREAFIGVRVEERSKRLLRLEFFDHCLSSPEDLPSKTPPIPRNAAAVITPSGAAPIPISMSYGPLDLAAQIAAETSPSSIILC